MPGFSLGPHEAFGALAWRFQRGDRAAAGPRGLYGRRDRLGADLRRRLLTWGIMHRYSNSTWRLRRRPERRRAVAIYGPTSSGKTALSLDVCEAVSERGLRPVVLNADSRQVYAGMDIGTSTIKPSQMRGFEHRLLDVAERSSKLSLEAYAQMARGELASLAASGMRCRSSSAARACTSSPCWVAGT
jgi:hypothetical protein